MSNGLTFEPEVVEKLCPSAIPFSNYNGRSLYTANREASTSPRPPHRLQPLVPINLPQARWEHARRMLMQKPIAVEPAKFRAKKSLFYMTEVTDFDDDDDDERKQRAKERYRDDQVLSTIRSESSEETTTESMSGIRRGHDTIEKQARIIAEKDFAQMERNWDKYMFEHMDENTAKFIILKHVHDGKVKGMVFLAIDMVRLF